MQRNSGYSSISDIRSLADQAFSRAAGAPLIEGNGIRLLKDAAQNYPAWLDAISSAKHHVYFENYIIREDATGEKFANALIKKAREGVCVRLIYDWVGNLRITSGRFWKRMKDAGIDVRCYNPPRIDSPLGWVSRDHRKMLSVDSATGFVSGLCVGRMWEGYPEKNIAPWRDTGIELRGPAVVEMENAFSALWAMTGKALPKDEISDRASVAPAGSTAVRIVSSVPSAASLFRIDQLVAALARKRLWLTDAYYAGMAMYVQALREAAKDGVDVRLLVPNSTDIPVLKPLSRAGYRTLLEAGVRIFEWNGSMLHAKTAVADGHWARVGSTNLNLASWIGNCELDAVVEDESFAGEMEEMYVDDLANSTEVVLNMKHRVCVQQPWVHDRAKRLRMEKGSAGIAATGAVRISNTVGAAITNRRMIDPVEGYLIAGISLFFLAIAALFIIFPCILRYLFAAVCSWFGGTLLIRSVKLLRENRRMRGEPGEDDDH